MVIFYLIIINNICDLDYMDITITLNLILHLSKIIVCYIVVDELYLSITTIKCQLAN